MIRQDVEQSSNEHVTPLEVQGAAAVLGALQAGAESDEILAGRRDSDSFTELYRRHLHGVYRYVAARVGNRQEAEDVTSDAFQRAWSSRGKYQADRPFRAWLFGIVRHALADHHRRSPTAAAVDLERADRLADEAQSFDRRHDHLELRDRCAAVLALLSQEQQEVLYLRFIAELSYPEIALVVGKREDTVKKIVYRAGDAIRRRFKQDE